MLADPLAVTSFDRNARYRWMTDIRRRFLGRPPLRVLDVGDPFGTISALFPDDDTFSCDLATEGAATISGHHKLMGSGLDLPFPDGAFDLVASHDTLEHLPAGSHARFLSELLRVGRGPVVVVAPFADPRTELCELLVNAYFQARTGRSLAPLDEHSGEGGLPDLDQVVAAADALGVPHVESSGGWLDHWLAMMMLKAHFAASLDLTTDRRFDAAFNLSLTETDDRTPHYRRVVVLRPPEGLVLPPPNRDPAGADADSTRLAGIAGRMGMLLKPGDLPDLPASALRAALSTGGLGPGSEVLTRSLSELFAALDGSWEARPAPTATGPTVAVVVVAADRRRAAAAASDLAPQVAGQPGAELVIVVDSADDALDGVPARFVVDSTPDYILRLNRVVEAIDHECVVLADPAWEAPGNLLSALLAGYDPTAGVVCVGVETTGEPGPVALEAVRNDGPRHLFAPRHAMLIRRQEYRGLGGLDGALRGVLDDVDFGWRLNLAGYSVGRVPVACRRRPDAAPRVPSVADQAAALARMYLKNLETANVWVALGPELVAAQRTAADGDLARTLWGDDGPFAAAAQPALWQARETMQSIRQVGDAEVASRFGRPSLITQAAVAGIPGAPAVLRRSRPRVAVFGTTMRASDLAGLLADWVTVAGPGGEIGAGSGAPGAGGDRPFAAAATADVVVMEAGLASRFPGVAFACRRLVLDVSGVADVPDALASAAHRLVCANSRQRDYWRGRLAVDEPVPTHDPGALDRRLVVVPPPAEYPGRPLRYGETGITAAADRVIFDLRGGQATPAAVAAVAQAVAGGSHWRVAGWVDPGDLAVWSEVAPAVAWEEVGAMPQDAQWESLARCRLTVRPTSPAGRLHSPYPALQSVGAVVPVAATADDPAAEVIAGHRCGVVVASVEELAGVAPALAGHPVRWATAAAGCRLATLAVSRERLVAMRGVVEAAMRR
jgi:SAM-dependent methyltransferase